MLPLRGGHLQNFRFLIPGGQSDSSTSSPPIGLQMTMPSIVSVDEVMHPWMEWLCLPIYPRLNITPPPLSFRIGGTSYATAKGDSSVLLRAFGALDSSTFTNTFASHSYNYPLDYHDDLFGHTWVSLALYRSYKDTAHNFLIWTQQTSVSIFILVMSVIQFMFSHTHTVTLSTCSTCCPKLLFSGSSL